MRPHYVLGLVSCVVCLLFGASALAAMLAAYADFGSVLLAATIFVGGCVGTYRYYVALAGDALRGVAHCVEALPSSQMPKRPTPVQAVGGAFDWYTGAQMLEYGRACADAQLQLCIRNLSQEDRS